MICVHLKEIDRLCHNYKVEISRTDMVRMVCTECGEHEVCPSNVMPDDIESSITGSVAAPSPRTVALDSRDSSSDSTKAS